MANFFFGCLTATGSQNKVSGYAQLITVLFIFVAVLGITAYVTKWMADYQKNQNHGKNMEILDSLRVTNNKWIQVVRIGSTLKVIAICKDTITYLGDLDSSDLEIFMQQNPDGKSEGKAGFRSHIQEALNSLQDKKPSE